jgi:glycosyltransferase involved in cell wall biosynthesis
LLTIAITCFREGPLLGECWKSVLAQTASSWQAVLVMDGGADATTRHEFEKISHPRLRKIALSENHGPYATRNVAFQATPTPWHYYVDGDDLLEPNAVDVLLQAVHSEPGVDVFYTDIWSFSPGRPPSYLASAASITPDSLTSGHAIFGASLIRTDLWRRLGGFAAELNWTLGDLDFFMSACEQQAAFHHVAQPLYRYRRRADSVAQKYVDQYHDIYALLVGRHPVLFAEDERRRRFLAMGDLMTASFHNNAIQMDESERFALRSLSRHDTPEARDLLRRIRRDRTWPPSLLRLRRKVSRYLALARRR